MNYSKFFTSELDKLKKEGLYRKFREIDRPIKKFPKADETQGEDERDVYHIPGAFRFDRSGHGDRRRALV